MRNYKNNLLHRLKIVRGHLDRVIVMVEKDEYCFDVIQQSMAVQNALKKVDELILENHLKTCVREAMMANHDVESKVKEIITVFQKK